MLKKGMLFLSTLLLIFSCSDSVSSETTSVFRTYGGNYNDFGYNVALTNDGGYLLVGRSYKENLQYDAYATKINSSGSEISELTLKDETNSIDVNDAFSAEVYDIKETDDGGFIMVGSKYNATTGWDILLIKIDALGVLDQSFNNPDDDVTTGYGYVTVDVGTNVNNAGAADDQNVPSNRDDKGYSVVVNDDGSYTVVGIVQVSASGGYDIYAGIVPENGQLAGVTGNVFEGEGADYTVADATGANGDYDDFAMEINKTADGGYIVAGSTRNSSDDSQLLILELTSDLNESSRLTSGESNGDEYGSSAIQSTDGGYVIAGYTYSQGEGQSDFYIEKRNGINEFKRVIGGSKDDKAASISQTSDGGYIVVGSTYSYGNGQSDIMLVKLDEEGNEDWRQTYGGVSDDFATAVMQTPDGGFVISGYKLGFMYDALLIKTNSVGVQEF